MKFNLKKGDTIFLYQFLKASGLYDDYSQIRHEIRRGNVSVNEQVTTNQREELTIGDEVRHKDAHYKIVERPPLPPRDNKTVSRDSSNFRRRDRSESENESSNPFRKKADRSNSRRSFPQKEHHQGDYDRKDAQQSKDNIDNTHDAEIQQISEKKTPNIRHGHVNKWSAAPLKIEEKINADIDEISRYIHQLMIDVGLTISFAESCTGGLIQSMITEHSGSSSYFSGGIVSYSNEAKRSVLNVKNNLLNKFGAVSEEVAIAMVKGVQKLFDTDLAASVTGIAGPTGGTSDKPVGTVFIALINKGQVVCRKLNLSGDRDLIRKKSALEVFKLIKETIIL